MDIVWERRIFNPLAFSLYVIKIHNGLLHFHKAVQLRKHPFCKPSGGFHCLMD